MGTGKAGWCSSWPLNEVLVMYYVLEKNVSVFICLCGYTMQVINKTFKRTEKKAIRLWWPSIKGSKPQEMGGEGDGGDGTGERGGKGRGMGGEKIH